MSDDALKLDSNALDGFTAQLNDLLRDTSATLFPDSFGGGMGDPGVEGALADIASTDLRVGQRLNAYLTALAGLTSTSAKAARDLDQALAYDVPAHDPPAHAYGHWMEAR